MSQTYVNALSGLAGCHKCGWEGTATDAVRAHRQADRHKCDLADVEAYRVSKAERVGEQAGRGVRREDSRGMAKNALSLSGKLKKVTSSAPKEVSAGWGVDAGTKLVGGALQVTIEVPRPELGSPPSRPNYHVTPQDPGDEPVFQEPAKEESESAKDHRARVAKAKKDHEADRWKWESAKRNFVQFESSMAEYDKKLAAYEQEKARAQEAIADYMNLAALGTMLQGLPIAMTLRPDVKTTRKLLPGFEFGFDPMAELTAPAEADAVEAAG